MGQDARAGLGHVGAVILAVRPLQLHPRPQVRRIRLLARPRRRKWEGQASMGIVVRTRLSLLHVRVARSATAVHILDIAAAIQVTAVRDANLHSVLAVQPPFRLHLRHLQTQQGLGR